MARTRNIEGSTTKEFPLAAFEAVLRAITPGMTYTQLLQHARSINHGDIPGILQARFLRIDNDVILHDHFLSLIASEGFSNRVRKVMYFHWIFDDHRLRPFILQRVADQHGIWREQALLDDASEDILRPHFAPGSETAHKTRTNIVRLLQTLNIYQPGQNPVFDLDLSDGWLAEAVRVAAQYEDNPAIRAAMVSSPGQYLVANGWQGMANATTAQLLGLPPVEQDDPLADDVLPSSDDGHDWNRPAPTPGAMTTTATLNPVAQERARLSHHRLEKMMADAVRAAGHMPKQNNQMDLYFQAATVWFIAEMKSCTDENYQAQVRKGVSQLLEYRFRHSQTLGANTPLVLVVEIPPPPRLFWIVDWLQSLGILCVWPELATMRLVTEQTPHAELAGIVTKV